MGQERHPQFPFVARPDPVRGIGLRRPLVFFICVNDVVISAQWCAYQTRSYRSRMGETLSAKSASRGKIQLDVARGERASLLIQAAVRRRICEWMYSANLTMKLILAGRCSGA